MLKADKILHVCVSIIALCSICSDNVSSQDYIPPSAAVEESSPVVCCSHLHTTTVNIISFLTNDVKVCRGLC